MRNYLPMRRLFTNWFKPSKPITAGSEHVQANCSACNDFKEVLYLIMDGEATKEQEAFFKQHIDECAPCLDHYNIEQSMVRIIREKLDKKTCPEQIIRAIKAKIDESPV
jgi:mycothiol system anti-sigma-R factor